ncbi:unnamed protein product [Lactuca virosa]|uniref:Uncharacterized protein n=1 Tax=Lactuca virosa TaxID=75947 RepID=A0AAU9PIQ3_9ASTR|nr:unnamed protein product [Lactuca virosa]
MQAIFSFSLRVMIEYLDPAFILKNKIKELESENELLRNQKVVVELITTPKKKSPQLQSLNNGHEKKDEFETPHVEQEKTKVSVFMVLGIILLGVGFGYWLVRKYIISEDGEVDVGVAVTCIILSTKDTPLAMAAVGSCLGVYYMITKIVRKMPCRIYATLKELSLEFMKRNNFVSPKVAYETATALQV